MISDTIGALIEAIEDVDGVETVALTYAPQQLRSTASGIVAHVVPASATWSQVMQRRRQNDLEVSILLTTPAGPEGTAASTDLLDVAEAIMAALADGDFAEYHVSEQQLVAIADERLIGSSRIHVLQLTATLKQESEL